MPSRSWRITLFDWDDGNLDHIAEHGVESGEAEEIFRGRLYVRRKGERYIVLGQTATGRRLFTVVIRLPGPVLRVITARDMNGTERRLFERSAR
jgi:uncharacterized DUF497 family protein